MATRISTIDDWFQQDFIKIQATENLLDSEVPTCFDDEVFRQLPEFLALAVSTGSSQDEKSLILFITLVFVSGALPKYVTKYRRKRYAPNCYGYVFGPFGCGKGKLSELKILLSKIQKERLSNAQQLKKYLDNGEKICGCEFDCSCEQVVPKLTLILPGDSTKAALYEVLKDNNGRGMLIETEGDTITAAANSEHGKFFDILRACYHHEEVSYSRKGEGMFFIERPCLTVAISSTPKQLRKLIVDVENGLFSRFMFFKVVPDPSFEDVFDDMDGYEEVLDELSKTLLSFYSRLDRRTSSVEFCFSREQKKMFLVHFRELKHEFRGIYGAELDGVVHRLGLMFARIAMIFSMLRIVDADTENFAIPDKIICKDEDFETIKVMFRTISKNTQLAYEVLTGVRQTEASMMGLTKKQSDAEREAKVIELHQQGLAHSKIAFLVFGKETLKGSVNRILQRNGLTKASVSVSKRKTR